MYEYPQYEEDGEEFVHFPNIWRDITPQPMVGADCFLPFAQVNNGMNRFVMDITGADFREMFSSLLNGSQFTYPQKWMQIIINFLKMVHCPIDFEEDCQEYPTYTPIIQYAPMNPFMNPDEIPEGYLVPPFVFVSEENIAEYGDYEIGDVIVPIDAITLDLDWFETLDGQLPTITINVEGEGKISMKLLTVPFGGVAIITLDNPPDLLDILAGIITGSDNILDVNRDIVSIPPETTEHVSYELEVTGAGMHTVYIVFLPVLDDSLIPVRFGGGLRSIELCEFGEVLVPYVEDIRFHDDSQMLQFFKAGIWHDVTEWLVLMDYIFNAADNADLALAQNVSQDVLIENLDLLASEAWGKADNAQSRLDILEPLVATHDTSIANLSTDVEALEDRVDALEASAASAQVWSEEFDFTTGQHGWAGGDSYVADHGFIIDNVDNEIFLTSVNIYDARITHVELHTRGISGSSGFITAMAWWPNDGNEQFVRLNRTADALAINWMQINPEDGQYSPSLKLVFASSSVYIEKIIVWGRGTNPF